MSSGSGAFRPNPPKTKAKFKVGDKVKCIMSKDYIGPVIPVGTKGYIDSKMHESDWLNVEGTLPDGRKFSKGMKENDERWDLDDGIFRPRCGICALKGKLCRRHE